MIIWSFVPFFAFSQTNNRYPTTFGHYIIAPFTINPVNAMSDVNTQISLGNQENVGPLRRIRSYYLYAAVNIYKNEKGARNHLGVYATNERDGEYISRAKLYLNYSWHTKLREKLWIGAGSYLGFINYNFIGTSSTAGGSDIAPDGSLGILLYNEKFKFGLSGNQIFSSSLQPIVNIYKFPIFYNLTFERSFFVSPYVTLQPYIFLSWKKSNQLVDINLGILSLIHDRLKIGSSYTHHRMVSFLLGVENIKIEKHFFRFYVCYNQPTSLYNILQSIELSINYLHKK